jgi:Poly (ADP-ribose) glycohydrolase (PARG)
MLVSRSVLQRKLRPEIGEVELFRFNSIALVLSASECHLNQGDSLLKMMIQWIAAAMAQKELIYYCFRDANLAKELRSIVNEFSYKTAGLKLSVVVCFVFL